MSPSKARSTIERLGNFLLRNPWIKTVGQLKKTCHRGGELAGWMFSLNAVAYNLVGIRSVTAAVSP
jgi:hypothetical protein